MTCAELESLLADYVDDTLAPVNRAALELHASACKSCSELVRDVTGAVRFIKGVDEISPPPELVTRIAYQVPVGRTREPLDRPGLLASLARKWLQPFLQPRWVMGMAMTILSFSMLDRCTGIRVQRIDAADLNPIRVWGGIEDKAIRIKDRAVKNYENLRLVYEIETRLNDVEREARAAEGRPQQAKHPGLRNRRGTDANDTGANTSGAENRK